MADFWYRKEIKVLKDEGTRAVGSWIFLYTVILRKSGVVKGHTRCSVLVS